MIMSDFINNPLIHDVFCVQDFPDLDKILKDREITVVNYAFELGMVEFTSFGLFFSLLFSNTVVRRPDSHTFIILMSFLFCSIKTMSRCSLCSGSIM